MCKSGNNGAMPHTGPAPSVIVRERRHGRGTERAQWIAAVPGPFVDKRQGMN